MEPVFRYRAVAVVDRLEAEADGISHPVHCVDCALEGILGIGNEAPAGLGNPPFALVHFPSGNFRLSVVSHTVSIAIHIELRRGNRPMGIGCIGIRAIDYWLRRVIHMHDMEADFIIATRRGLTCKYGVNILVKVERIANIWVIIRE